MKTLFQKKITVLFLLTLLFNSCQKKVTDQLSLNTEYLDAKEWFDKNRIKIFKNEILINSIIKDQEKSQLEWNNAIKNKFKPDEIEIPIVESKTRSFIPNSRYSSDTSLNNNLLKLVLKKSNDGEYVYSFKLNIGNYHFLKTRRDKQRHFEYQSDYTGIVIFLDKNGQLLDGEKYLGGRKVSKINSIRKLNILNSNSELIQSNSIKSTNISEPPEDIVGTCSGTLYTVWQQDCIANFVNDIFVGSECGAWYAVDQYFIGTCNNGSGDVSSNSPNEGFTSDDGRLSCKSFSFNKLSSTSNWQEAGVKGLQFVGDVPGGPPVIKTFRPLFIGLPFKKLDGTEIKPGEAAEAAAKAANRAGLALHINYIGMNREQFLATPASTIEREFRILMQSYLSEELGCSSSVTAEPSGLNTKVRTAVWNLGLEILWNGLTGGGCN